MRRAVDTLLLATLFTMTFTKLRWEIGPVDVRIGELFAAAFIALFVIMRIRAGDWRVPRTVQVLSVFFLILLLVYLIGYFNLSTIASRNLYVKGMITFGIHFTFLMAAVSHLARRSERLLWRAVRWFCAGLAVNAAYGLVALAYAEGTNGGDLDKYVIEPITGEAPGLQLFGVTGGLNIYRTNGLTLDPNHLGIMLVVPLLVLLPVYLRLPRGSSLRVPLAVLLGALFLVELATISRSALLGLGVGLIVLAIPYGRRFLSARFLVPLAGLLAVMAVIVERRSDFFESILRVRTNLGSSSTQTHFELYDLLGPGAPRQSALRLRQEHVLRLLRVPHGQVELGAAQLLPQRPHRERARRRRRPRRLPRLRLPAPRRGPADRLRARGRRRPGATLMRALAWGITAALVGTMAANVFYLTMQMYYFTGLIALGARRSAPPRPPGPGGHAAHTSGARLVRVLVLTTSYPRNETDFAGRFLADTVDRLRARGLEVDLLAPGRGYSDFGLAYGEGMSRNIRKRPWAVPPLLGLDDPQRPQGGAARGRRPCPLAADRVSSLALR